MEEAENPAAGRAARCPVRGFACLGRSEGGSWRTCQCLLGLLRNGTWATSVYMYVLICTRKFEVARVKGKSDIHPYIQMHATVFWKTFPSSNNLDNKYIIVIKSTSLQRLCPLQQWYLTWDLKEIYSK